MTSSFIDIRCSHRLLCWATKMQGPYHTHCGVVLCARRTSAVMALSIPGAQPGRPLLYAASHRDRDFWQECSLTTRRLNHRHYGLRGEDGFGNEALGTPCGEIYFGLGFGHLSPEWANLMW